MSPFLEDKCGRQQDSPFKLCVCCLVSWCAGSGSSSEDDGLDERLRSEDVRRALEIITKVGRGRVSWEGYSGPCCEAYSGFLGFPARVKFIQEKSHLEPW